MLPNKIKALLTEVDFQATRSGGSGGQNVNKVATKVELYFDVKNSKFLSDEEKEKFISKQKTKISDQGILKLMSQTERTQLGNKKRVIEKFENLIKNIFTEKKKRIAVTLSKAEIENRLREKKIQAEKKERRKNLLNDDGEN